MGREQGRDKNNNSCHLWMAHNMPGISYQASHSTHCSKGTWSHLILTTTLGGVSCHGGISFDRGGNWSPERSRDLPANKWWSQYSNLGSLTSGFDHWCVYLFQGLNGRRLFLWFWRYTIEQRNAKFKEGSTAQTEKAWFKLLGNFKVERIENVHHWSPT